MCVRFVGIKIKSLSLFLLLIVFSSKLFANDDLAWAYQYAILTAVSDSKRKPVLSILYADAKKLDPLLADSVAELLLSQVNNGKTKDDGLNWYGKILAGTKKVRYRDTLQEIAYKTDSAEVEKRARKYLKKLKKDKEEDQYTKGSIDMPGTIQQYALDSENGWPKNKQLQISDISKKTSIFDVLETLGRPQHVASGRVEGLVVPKLYFYYRGIGRIEFKHIKNRKKIASWRIASIVDEPLAFDLELPHHGINEDGSPKIGKKILMAMLLDDGLYAPRQALLQQFHSDKTYPEFLDTAAEMLIRGFKTKKTKVKTDTFAWICRLLAEKGGLRYQNILATVARESTIFKLIDFANTPINPNGAANVTQEYYQPGSINMDQQYEQYPSPYL